MGRVRLELPEHLRFTTRLTVRVTDLNYGAHVGNDVVLAFCHEARAALFEHLGFTELDVAGLGIVVADAVVVYRSEIFAGEHLEIAVDATDHNRYGCDIVYRLTEAESGREVTKAKTGIVFFDYAERRVAEAPPVFRERLNTRL